MMTRDGEWSTLRPLISIIILIVILTPYVRRRMQWLAVRSVVKRALDGDL